ncbi:beta-galactosidase, partial [bacterium]
HIYDLSRWLTPGKHIITIRVDNRIKDIDPGRDAHSVSDNTQTNWNGMIGKMSLANRPAVYISDVRLFPDIENKTVRAYITISNILDKEISCRIRVRATPANMKAAKKLAAITREIQAKKDTTLIVLDYPMGKDPALWDEFDPNVYTFKTVIKSEAGTDDSHIDFGLKKFVVSGKRFSINGRPLFLRGTLECAIFPKTGYPSVSVNEWMEIYRKCKEYGLNHVRFHSWCPPEAAFIAADRLGIYLSVENSAWAHLGDGAPIDQYIYDESNRIVRNFGNHPSFCMMPYGNEASGDSASKFLTGFIRYWQNKDNRRVYTAGSGFPESPASDYTSSGAPRIQWWEAGLSSPINANPPTTDFDWTQYLDKTKPTVSHEIGQWCVYPDFKEMNKYDGVLKPKNFEIFQEKLAEHGMGNYADSFLLASGKLQVLCYKADIEAAFRTNDFAGFQLLDLHDFPGQGTALVGVLNAFWQEKGYVTAKEYRRFCNTTVPLLRMKKMIWLNNEVFTAHGEIAHFGKN